MNIRRLGTAMLVVAGLLIASPIMAQPRPGKGPMGKGPGGDPGFAADRDLFHDLLEHRADIRRDVKKTEQGVETLTESEKPEVVAAIQEHVASMEKRVKDKQPSQASSDLLKNKIAFLSPRSSVRVSNSGHVSTIAWFRSSKLSLNGHTSA